MYVIGDFNLEKFKRIAKNDERFTSIGHDIEISSFDQSIYELIRVSNESTTISALFVWCLAERISETFRDLIEGKCVETENIEVEIDEYCQYLIHASYKSSILIVADLITLHEQRGMGALENKPPSGINFLLMKMNVLLREKLSSYTNIFLLNTQSWLNSGGNLSRDARGWFMVKDAFSNSVYKNAIDDIIPLLYAKCGIVKKLVIVDLDNTLWGGVIGDDGIENVKLGGHDAVGEAFLDFQSCLLALRRKGILLAICSKNEEHVALNCIRSHEAMVLGISDFVTWRINWKDKAQNIVEICNELNLGLDSVVFIDDNPAERGRVKEALSKVLVLDMPNNPLMYSTFLRTVACFDRLEFTVEDHLRHNMYKQEKIRSEELTVATSHDEWLESLNLVVEVNNIDSTNIQRVVQLLNKTNQMNFLTRRMTSQELSDWLSKGVRKLWVFKVSDRFGDSGLTGVVFVEHNADGVHLVDFVLSCRVFNRMVENVMIDKAISYAINNRETRLFINFVKSTKNMPALEFLDGLDNCTSSGDGQYCINGAAKQTRLDCISIDDYSS